MIGIDSTVVIDLFKGNPKIKKLLENIDEPLCITRITYLELMFGLDFENQKHKIEESFYDEFFETVHVFELEKKSCKKASQIYRNLRKSGKEIDEMDCSIAGIFLSQGIFKIITKNEKHFNRISEVKVICY